MELHPLGSTIVPFILPNELPAEISSKHSGPEGQFIKPLLIDSPGMTESSA